ncbi:hypothetical protein DM01DRAFT_1411743 [Hesseltinella vesiculosa]|uniref:Uncharacterized protein n=1 Tax=Hesseltinella vesiculosa TaxID=101127 RepID=A0A1X2G2K1_9FUNG|nr:hypothetical protein DM01DRAFT_1411743 [Hesseltinella vesiculosa]
MTFKSKQREKHGHLFGDDPLNATTLSSTSETTSNATRRKDFPFDPLSASSSRSSSPSSSSGGIFGNIDVSKLGKRSTRSSFRLNAASQDDDEALFGGTTRTSISSTTSSPSSRASQSLLAASPTSPALASVANEASHHGVTQGPSPAPSRPVPARVSPTPSVSQQRRPPPPPPPRRSNAPSPSLTPSPSMSSPSLSPPPPPPRMHKKHLQSLYKANSEPEVVEVANEEAQRLQEQKAAMMEDEATRAFAMDPSTMLQPSAKPSLLPDDVLAPSFDTLAIQDTHQPTSTPSTSVSNRSDEDDPWQPVLTPTCSTPLDKKTLEHIAPAKQRAFADLIANWHGVDEPTTSQDAGATDQLFFESVASEQRDIGFAGIEGQAAPTMATSHWQDDQYMESNPWS